VHLKIFLDQLGEIGSFSTAHLMITHGTLVRTIQWLKNTGIVRIWKQIKSHFKLRPIFYALHITGNPTFPPSILDNTFNLWKNIGILTIGDLYIKGIFASYAYLQSKYNLPGSSFFRYFKGSCLDRCPEKLISYIYEILQSISPVNSTLMKTKLEEEMGTKISDTVGKEFRTYSSML